MSVCPESQTLGDLWFGLFKSVTSASGYAYSTVLDMTLGLVLVVSLKKCVMRSASRVKLKVTDRVQVNKINDSPLGNT